MGASTQRVRVIALNTTEETVDIGGWYLSDSNDDLLKFEIPANTLLAPGKYMVFDESHFNPTPLAPRPNDFALSGDAGDDVWLVISDGFGGVASFVDEVSFGASLNGESLGRIPNAHGRLAPLGRNTLGCANTHARVGPLIISEINYNPGDSQFAEDDLEFVEVHNPTTRRVALDNWRLRSGVDFDFAPDSILGAGETLVIISFDPLSAANAARLGDFRTHYGIDDSVRIVGGWQGQLSDSGEELRRLRPDAPPPEDPSLTPRVIEDAVRYDDLAPWPVAADGTSDSLVRTVPTAFAGSAANWTAAMATPGLVDFPGNQSGDFNRDGQATDTDIDLLWDAVRRGSNVTSYDLDNNSVVDQDDVSHLVETVLDANLGDANLDGVVNSIDLNQVGIHWQEQTCNGWASGDFTGDGAAMAADLNEVGVNWQRGLAQAAQVDARAKCTPRAPLVGVAIAEPVLIDSQRESLSLVLTDASDKTNSSEPEMVTHLHDSELHLFHRHVNSVFESVRRTMLQSISNQDRIGAVDQIFADLPLSSARSWLLVSVAELGISPSLPHLP